MTRSLPVPEAQERPEAITAATAFGRRYDIAQWWRLLVIAVGLALPVAGSILVLRDEGAAVALGAISGAWAVLGRYVAGALEAGRRREGARAQEAFDCLVLGLEWNRALAGRRPAPEDLRDWGRGRDSADRHDWYPVEVGPALWPLDTLLCQRANVVWGRRNHERYGYVAAILAGLLFAATLVVGMIAGLDLSAYLVRLGLPSLPALLIAGELFTGHRRQARAKGRIEEAIEAAWRESLEAEEPVGIGRCRGFQDSIFETRTTGATIPRWYYHLRLGRDEEAMHEAAAERVAELPTSLRRP